MQAINRIPGIPRSWPLHTNGRAKETRPMMLPHLALERLPLLCCVLLRRGQRVRAVREQLRNARPVHASLIRAQAAQDCIVQA